MLATLEVLPETNAWKDSFPQSFDEYFINKPSNINYLDWLVHPANPYKFTPTIKQILRIIEQKSHMTNYTFFFQETLAKMVGYGDRWVRELIKRLTEIEILTSKKVHKNRQFQIIPKIKGLLFGNKSPKPSVTEINQMLQEASEQDRVKYNQPLGQSVITLQDNLSEQNIADWNMVNSGKNSSKNSGEKGVLESANNSKNETYLSTSLPLKQIIKNNLSSKIVNISEDVKHQISQLFEELTGSKFIPKRDTEALLELSNYDKVVVEIGMLESALLAPAKINTLKYMLGQVRAYHQATQPQFIAQQSKEKGVTLSVLGTETLLIILKSRRHRWAKRQESLKQV